MFSDALKAMDRNTVQYMIDEQKAEINSLSQAVSNKDCELARKEKALAEKDKELEQLREQLAMLQKNTTTAS